MILEEKLQRRAVTNAYRAMLRHAAALTREGLALRGASDERVNGARRPIAAGDQVCSDEPRLDRGYPMDVMGTVIAIYHGWAWVDDVRHGLLTAPVDNLRCVGP